MRIGIINTGGTISCVGDPLAPMDSEEFAAACRQILEPILTQAFPDLELEYLTQMRFPQTGESTLDSTNLQPADWCVVAAQILDNYQDYDAWVVLHGTDTMAYTASALPFLLSAFDAYGNGTAVLSKPVILTGSQVPLFYRKDNEPLTLRYSTDAYQNLCAAVAFARTGIPEVALAFRGKLLRGCRAVKVSSDMDDAFDSPNLPPLGTLGINLQLNTSMVLPGPWGSDVSLDNPAVQAQAQARLAHIAGTIDRVKVAPMVAFPAPYDSQGGFLAELLDAAQTAGAEALVLESYGEGNFPSGATKDDPVGAVQGSLKRANDNGIVIVNCTQVISGTVNDSAYAAGAWLSQVGALSPGDMTSIAAFAKATVLLAEAQTRHHDGWEGNNWGPETVKNLMRECLLGEKQQSDRLQLGWHQELLGGQKLLALDDSAMLYNDPHSGVQLKHADGTVLWQPNTLEARLYPEVVRLTPHGVVIRDRQGQILWEAAVPSTASAHTLTLRGSAADGTLRLVVSDRQGTELMRLYPAAKETSVS